MVQRGAKKDGKKKKKNGAKRSKKKGKGKKKKNGLKKKSRKNNSKSKGKGKKDRKEKKARKAAKKDEKKDNKKKAKKQKKKARKQQKKAEKKKAKKDRKRKNNRKANTARNTTSSSCMNASCINNAILYMKQLKLAVKNFGKQYNRISTNSKQSSGKSGKSDEFKPYLIKLRETGGGNASNMTCNGEKGVGATNLQTLYDNLETCEVIINSTCHEDNMPAVNMTFLDACKATMDGFVNETNKAIAATGAAACVIWESELLANMSGMLKDCSLKETESGHTAAKKACTGNFSYCRQEEDKVSKLVSACSASNSVARVTADIAQGAKNQAAATAVSSKVNATLAATRSAAFRSTDYSCGDFATKVTAVSSEVKGASLHANLETMLTTLANATIATCTDDEKTSLGNASTTFLSSTEFIAVAIADKQSVLNITTGTTISVAAAIADNVTLGPTVATTVFTVSTAATGTTGTATTGTTGTATTGAATTTTGSATTTTGAATT